MPSKAALNARTADRLLKSLFVLSRTVTHILETRAVETALGTPLSSSKVKILRMLGEQGHQTSSQLARFLGVSKPAVTQVIDSMVDSKLVVRRPAARDRREVVLRLTKRGKTQYDLLRREQRHLVRSAAPLVRGANADKWIETMQNVAGALAQADQAFADFCLQCGAYGDASCVLRQGDLNCLFVEHAKSKAKSVAPGTVKRRSKKVQSRSNRCR